MSKKLIDVSNYTQQIITNPSYLNNFNFEMCVSCLTQVFIRLNCPAHKSTLLSSKTCFLLENFKIIKRGRFKSGHYTFEMVQSQSGLHTLQANVCFQKAMKITNAGAAEELNLVLMQIQKARLGESFVWF